LAILFKIHHPVVVAHSVAFPSTCKNTSLPKKSKEKVIRLFSIQLDLLVASVSLQYRNGAPDRQTHVVDYFDSRDTCC
jgi:hypothetical protein